MAIDPFSIALGLGAASLFGGGGGGGSGSSSTQTVTQQIDPAIREAYLANIQQARGVAAALPTRQFQGFTPLYEAGERQLTNLGLTPFMPEEISAFQNPYQQQAMQAAGAATLGALSTGYNPYTMGQFTSGAAAQYMNPFLEQAIEPQLREAQRASEIQRAANQAQAVRARAFGGSRQGIIEAERQSNLAQQLGDIRGRGYASAFDQAQQQFAREQQLREQSRQYGAGLGLQGIQTALQGTSQIGQLGLQGYGQAAQLAQQARQIGRQGAIDVMGLGGARQQLSQQEMDALRNIGLERLAISQGALSGQLPNLGMTQTSPIYRNTGANILGGALLGSQIGGRTDLGAGWGAILGGGLGLLS